MSPLQDGLPSDEPPTWREYDQRWRDHILVHEAEERARKSAVVTINERLNGMNEFRNTVSDVVATMLSKVEFNAWREGMVTQQRWMVTTLLALGLLVIGVATFVAAQH